MDLSLLILITFSFYLKKRIIAQTICYLKHIPYDNEFTAKFIPVKENLLFHAFIYFFKIIPYRQKKFLSLNLDLLL